MKFNILFGLSLIAALTVGAIASGAGSVQVCLQYSCVRLGAGR